ncbi:MAG: DsbA family protein [Rhodospirillales bacterium]|nr:DsbA family protein [Rhodospirillales bacterium]
MFEKSIKLVSHVLTVLVMFFLADSFYLTQKGFVLNDGKIELLRSAQAAESSLQNIDTRSFKIDARYVLGKPNAPVTIYEFSSLGCTHCADFHLGILPKLKQDYIESGKVKLVFADFPIDKKSMQAAMLAHCMAQDKYFDFLGLLFKKQLTWGLSFKTEKLLAGYAGGFGLDSETAQKCMKDDKMAAEIMYVRQQAMERLNIKATPSFLVRSSGGDELITGVPSYSEFREVLNKKLLD